MGKIYTNKNTILLEKMIEIYKPGDIDWMTYLITNKNKLTFHHINPISNEGKTTLENGALITKKGHNTLNKIQLLDPTLFKYWNQLFKYINESKEPMNAYYIKESEKLKKHTKRLLYKK